MPSLSYGSVHAATQFSSQACMTGADTSMTTIRDATPADSAAWLRMRCALWPEGTAAEFAREVAEFFAGRLRMPLAVLLACDAAGDAVGFVELSIRSVVDSCE